MSPNLEGVILFLIIFALFAVIVYTIFYLIGDKKKIRYEIKKMFNAKESNGYLRFKYRNYDVMVTFRPDVKVSVLHNKNIDKEKAPAGARLTPIYLIFKIRKSREIVEKLDRYIDFLNTIPTQ